ncbi:YicC/YloC family endoribonuclease [Pseudosulfitobacter koreensis]|uniref:YicC family protein n=1 Tax=Pseudosulfitobacter koreensis TaxID=2968472 RepID=A0ABT1Z207_9RHOB|nr:YicC/YloC family endoribonuclease [Pseudosulfitobacter koreense]MCR8827153.1 YicC family protein [Pseudosulfitobacter koreense]
MSKTAAHPALHSMTAFAASGGESGVYRWNSELRSVNGKGLDIRVRAPDWIDGLEVALRTQVAAAVARGNVTLNIRVTREDAAGAVQVNAGQLAAVLAALTEIEAQAMDLGLSLAPSKATDIAVMRGVLEQSSGDQDVAPLKSALEADVAALLKDFVQMRAGEGAALARVLNAQLDQVAELTAQTARIAESRRDEVAANLRRNMARVVENADGVDKDRIAQELALLAVKSDITEEIDRLGAHVSAARDLIAEGGPVGRKLDFLSQEFNREVNTLCSKAQNTELTRVGLALKALIDQMREQVQNVE